MKTAVLGVIYPNIIKYLNDYVESFSKQSYKLFDIVLMLDNIEEEKVLNLFADKDLNFKTIVIKEKLSISEIRSIGINYILDAGYNRLIFSDTDDYFSKNRIEKSLEALETSDFCFNNIHLVDYESNLFSFYEYYQNKALPVIIDNVDILLNKNFIGLSNSALNLDRINLESLRFPPDIKAVDWYLYTFLLLKGYFGVYINDAITFYRQYGDNIAGAGQKYTSKRIIDDINLADIHYNNCIRDFGFDKFKHIINRFKCFKCKITSNQEYMERYLQYINTNINDFFWWEHLTDIIGGD